MKFSNPTHSKFSIQIIQIILFNMYKDSILNVKN